MNEDNRPSPCPNPRPSNERMEELYPDVFDRLAGQGTEVSGPGQVDETLAPDRGPEAVSTTELIGYWVDETLAPDRGPEAVSTTELIGYWDARNRATSERDAVNRALRLNQYPR